MKKEIFRDGEAYRSEMLAREDPIPRYLADKRIKGEGVSVGPPFSEKNPLSRIPSFRELPYRKLPSLIFPGVWRGSDERRSLPAER